MHRVLLVDNLHTVAGEILGNDGIKTITRNDLKPDDLPLFLEENEFDGLIVRSKTRVTPQVLAVPSLKVVGRAGTGVDTIDLPAATENGVLVMNTPGANSISVAELTFGLMLMMARNLLDADKAARTGVQDKSKFEGTELYGKTLGIIGAGNIGSLVAIRAQAFGMNILAHDPFVSEINKTALLKAAPNTRFVDLNTLISSAHFLTIHIDKQEQHILNASDFKQMKPGVFIVNAAREGMFNKGALQQAILNGSVAGAALDTYSDEIAAKLDLFNMNKIIFTTHLGASTKEAQERAAKMIAENVKNYLLHGAIRHNVNRPQFPRWKKEETKTAHAM